MLLVVVIHSACYGGVHPDVWYDRMLWGGNVGVTIFFLISGFLLYRPWATALLDLSPAPSIRVYARRRVLRIVPAYWLALTVLAIWPGVVGVPGNDWWAYYGLLQSYRLRWVFNGIPAAWSLSVEVAFYALLPLMALALRRTCRADTMAARARQQVIVLGTFAGVTLGGRGLVWAYGPPDLHLSILTEMPLFLVGMLTAVLSAWHELAPSGSGPRLVGWVERHGTTCWLGALILFTATTVWGPAVDGFDVGAYLWRPMAFMAIAWLMLLPAVFGTSRFDVARALLDMRGLRALGTVSYGVFLWHQPLMIAWVASTRVLVRGWPVLSVVLATVPATLVLATISWILVEKPAIALGRARRRADARVAPVERRPDVMTSPGSACAVD